MIRRKLNFKIFTMVIMIILLTFVFSTIVFAEDELVADTTIIDQLVNMLASIFQKMSVVVFFFGFLQMGFAIKSDNPDLKSQAIKTIAAAVVVFTVSTSVDIFLSLVK